MTPAISVAPRVNDVVGFLDKAESEFSERTFLRDEFARVSYGRVGELSRNALASLAGAGVVRGDRCLISAENHIDAIIFMLAALRIGAAVSLVHPGTTRRNLERIVAQIEPAAAVLDGETIRHVDLFSDCSIARIDADTASSGALGLKNLSGENEPSVAPVAAGPLDPALIIYTSGSTGEPHGVMASHDNVVFSTAAIQERLSYQADDIVGLFVPISFDYGLYQIFLAANVGASVFVGRPCSVGPGFVQLLERENITALPAIPGLIASLLRMLDRRNHELPYLRVVTSTGEHLPVQQIRKLQAHLPRVRIFSMYGLTECKRVSILLPDELETKGETVGRPLEGTRVRAVAPGGETLRSGQCGELVVSGRHVTLGYWNAREETNRRFRINTATAERELWTGDIGCIDDDGFVTVIGRSDSLLKHQGFRVSASEIETEASKIPGVVESAVVCSEADELHLYVRLSLDVGTAPDIQRFLRRNLEWFKVPEYVHVVDEMPRTLHGKTDKAQLPAIVNAELSIS